MLRVYVNTFNRVELALKTIASLRKNAEGEVEITIIDDGSTELMGEAITEADDFRKLIHCGNGEARRQAMKQFLCDSCSQGFALFTDGDMEFALCYDTFCLDALDCRATAQNLWASPYRSASHAKEDRLWFPGKVFGHTFGGATLFGSVTMVARMLATIPEPWTSLYDWDLVAASAGCIKPEKSLAQHIGGNDPTSLHPGSTDLAVDYVGGQ